MADEHRGWDDGGGWVVAEIGRTQWRILLPPAPPKGGQGLHARLDATVFHSPPAFTGYSRLDGWASGKARAPAGVSGRRRGAVRIVLRLVRLLRGRDRRRRRRR